MNQGEAFIRRSTGPSSSLGGVLKRKLILALLAIAVTGWPNGPALDALPHDLVRAVPERLTYNVGEEVCLRFIFASPAEVRPLESYVFAVRYAGEEKPLREGLILGPPRSPGASRRQETRAIGSFFDDGRVILNGPPGPPSASDPGWRLLWRIPLDARAGRYVVDLQIQDTQSRRVIQDLPHVGSFVVHRQVIQIVSAGIDRSYYTSGDSIGCTLKVENLSDGRLAGLRLEFSERYWPWIAQQREQGGAKIKTLEPRFDLTPRQSYSFSSPQCAEAKSGNEPTIKQYAAVVWDQERKNVYAIAFTPLVFVNPPGKAIPRPYPAWFIYPTLSAVNMRSYREFAPQPFGGDAIRFDTQHTMFAAGSEATINFSLRNPTDLPWRQVTVRARLIGPGQKEQSHQVVEENLDLDPHRGPRKEEAKFSIPPGVGGVYRALIEVAAASGQVLAVNTLELGANPLPKAVLLFCAHEDDDGTQMGFIRALVENQVPLHVIYFTSGDAGSCDRYYEHSCGPAEALNFGALRMDEVRAALGHLGVPRDDILFLGLPDGGSGKIWYEHQRSSDPYRAVLLASDHAPYEGLIRPNLPYAREAVVEATAQIIKKFQPDVLFTAHPPAEGHIDHIVCNYFVVKALQELVSQGAISPHVELRVDRIFDLLGHPATPYHYEEHTFYVSGEVMARAQEAGWYYQSQGGNRSEGNLRTWNQLPHSEGYRKVLDWNEHAGWNDHE